MSADLPLSPEDVSEIVSILGGGAYERLDITTPRFRLRVQRGEGGWTQEWDYSADAAPISAAPAAEAPPEAAVPEGLVGVPSPLPGTFYHAPSPGAPPFVGVGDSVGPESVIGIVETMKVMNPVYAGAHGVIAAVVVANAAPVTKGAVLLHLRPA